MVAFWVLDISSRATVSLRFNGNRLAGRIATTAAADTEAEKETKEESTANEGANDNTGDGSTAEMMVMGSTGG
jgi:hypothetical protein